MITFIKIILMVLFTGTLAVLAARRMFWCLTRRDFKSRGRTPSFYQMEDPYIASIMDTLYANGKPLKEATNEK
jgi:hypothetical protein